VAKPASGTALDTGHALYPNLAGYWGFLENSGTTSNDSFGTNHVGTFSNATWGVDSAGDPCISLSTNNTAKPLPLTSTITLGGGSTPWSLAWRMKQTTSNTDGMLLGNSANTADFVWHDGGAFLRYRNTASANADFAATVFTTEKDYVLTWDGTNARAYVNGSADANNPISITGSLVIDTFGNGYDVASAQFGLKGTISYIGYWTNRTLSGAEATSLAGNPYQIFSTGGGATKAPGCYQRRAVRFSRRF
jgi:hypothetical protein